MLHTMMRVHPFYYAFAPLAMLLRAVHCLPIMLRSKPATGSDVVHVRTFHKYSERCLPPDITFHVDNYTSFQFVQYRFARLDFLDTIRRKLDKWSRRHFGIAANIEACRGGARRFVTRIVKTRPSERIVNTSHYTTHLFALFPDTGELVGLLDHYYCDGIILFDFFAHVFEEIEQIKLPFPTYRYYPMVSDALACECTARVLYDTLRNPRWVTQYDDTRVLRRVIQKRDAPFWNRWSNYAMSVLAVFECTDGLPYVRVALNVGISTDSTFGNNRIGAILVRITRPPEHSTYPSKIECLMAQFEEKVTKNYTDCVVTYDIVRSYDMTMLRKFASSDVVDIIFTSMFIPISIDVFKSGLGAFIGNTYDYPYFYINSMTLNEQSHVTFTTNWTQFNHAKYVARFGARLMYTFDETRVTFS